MKGLILILILAVGAGCSSLKISGEFKMKNGKSVSFQNAKLKMDNKKAVVKVGGVETKIDMKDVDSVMIDVE